MTSFFDRYSTDKIAEEDGQWVDFGDGIKVQIRRLNSAKSREVRRKLDKPYSKQFRGGDLPDSLQESILNQQIAKAIVVSWEGVPDPDKPSEMLPCTEDNVLRMVRDYTDFREEILTASMERATYQKEDLKDAEKNSKSS